MFIQLKKDYFGQKAGARIDVDEPVAQTLLAQGIAEAVQGEPRATIIPMASDTIEVPTLDVTTAPAAGDTAFFGGLKASWSKEAASITETEPAFKGLTLTAHELTGYTLASNSLLADNAVGLEA